MAVARDATSARPVKNQRLAMAMRTPMSRTRSARAEKAAASSSGRPKSLTSSAPATLNRSVICVLMSALRDICSRVSACSRRPIQRAGSRNTGTSRSDTTVTCQDSANIATRTMTAEMRLPSTPPSVDVNACWAPMTSLFSREINAPVWARVKKAIDCRCTWSYTCDRRSKIRPSPIRAEYQRLTMPSPASRTASPAMSRAVIVTTRASPWLMPSSTSRGTSSGCATDSSETRTRVTRYTAMRPR